MTHDLLDRVAVVTLRAQDGSLYGSIDDLVRALESARADAAVLLVGRDDHVPPSFFASDEAEPWVRREHAAIDRIARSKKPIVAAIAEDVTGPGFEVALACHGVAMVEGARLGLAAAGAGVVPSRQGLPRLAARAPIERAIDVGVRRASIDAREASSLGLAQAITSREGLLESAAALARKLAGERNVGPKKGRSWIRSARALVELRAARREVRDETRGHYPAEERALDVLTTFATRGMSAAIEAEIKAFSELIVAEPTRVLMAVHASLQKLGGSSGDDRFTSAILRPLLDEAHAITTEGVSPHVVREALLAWGFPKSSRALSALAARGAEGSAKYPEELQMRCVLGLVNEAVRCLDEGMIAGPEQGDLAAIVHLGFPRFRGGPFRYVDAVGPREIVKRLARCQTRFGARFAPAQKLTAMADRGALFYPR